MLTGPRIDSICHPWKFIYRWKFTNRWKFVWDGSDQSARPMSRVFKRISNLNLAKDRNRAQRYAFNFEDDDSWGAKILSHNCDESGIEAQKHAV